MRRVVLLLWIFALLGCSASKKELKTSDELASRPVDANRRAQIVHFENELADWDKRALGVKSAAVALRNEQTYVNHTKAIDDLEGQMKAARGHLRDMEAANNEKEEADARNAVIENLTTIEKIYRQIQAE